MTEAHHLSTEPERSPEWCSEVEVLACKGLAASRRLPPGRSFVSTLQPELGRPPWADKAYLSWRERQAIDDTDTSQ